MLRWMALFCGLGLLSGCGTISSGASGCAGPWSGVRYDRDLIGSYEKDEIVPPEVPLGVDGWLGDAWDSVMVALDMPLSAVTDTLGAPLTAALGQRTPEPVGMGCNWASPGRS